MAVSNRNSFKLLYQKKGNKNWTNYFKSFVFRALVHNSFTGLIIKLPIIVIPLFLLFNIYDNVSYNSVPIYITGPVISGLILFFIINIPMFLFLGEAERYLNHISIFILMTVVFTAFATNSQLYLFIFLIYGVLFWLLEILTSQLYSSKTKETDNDIMQFLKSINEDLVILSYPYHAVGFWRILLETKHQVIRGMTGNKIYDNYFETNYADDYPYVKLDSVDRMHDELGLNLIIINNI